MVSGIFLRCHLKSVDISLLFQTLKFVTLDEPFFAMTILAFFWIFLKFLNNLSYNIHHNIKII
ncbi:hypothetical protein A9Z64_08135 [Moraxella osloensis]|nr:hypothetical protein AXE82_07840 [Moraxella osloensis]OBX55764.1 hypothetical protein A9Z64_08135 [Moraxella osloensis]